MPEQADPIALYDEKPIVFRNCFGWLHGSGRDVCVIICSNLGQDARNIYTSLRRLAIDLSLAGCATLRLDYNGAGDSADNENADRVSNCMRSIDDAIAVMLEAGARRIILCGFGVGALFCLQRAADHDEVDDVIVVDPIISGRLFLRGLQIAASIDVGQKSAGVAAIELDGATLAGEAAACFETLSALSLVSRPARRVLILSSSSSRNPDRLASHLAGLGVDTTTALCEPIGDVSNSGYVSGTINLMSSIEAWLPAVAATGQLHWNGILDEALYGADYLELPLRFGDRLFGVLCRPPAEAVRKQVVVIGNSGSGPRHGHARFHVRLARHLARAGIASLRLDFAGLGDSSDIGHGRGRHIYEENREADIGAAIDALAVLGYREFVAAGICSGAYHAWRASLADPRIGTVLMVNPATFSWQKGRSLEAAGAHSMQFYLASLAEVRGWSRLLRREFSLRRAFQTVYRQCVRHLTRPIAALAGHLGVATKRNAPLRSMLTLSRRGTRVLIAMGEGDAGLDVLTSHFGRAGRHLARMPGHAVRLVPGIDHAITRRAMQDDVAEVLVEFLVATPDAAMSKVWHAPAPEPLWRHMTLQDPA